MALSGRRPDPGPRRGRRPGPVFDLPRGTFRLEVAPDRGQVARLGRSPDGRSLIQFTGDGDAQVWDFVDGRAQPPIAGRWSDGAILPRDGGLVLAEKQTGDLVRFSPNGGRRLPAVYARPLSPTVARPASGSTG